MLFLYDNQLKNELFLEDINNILNLGEVPNIFTPEEKAEVNIGHEDDRITENLTLARLWRT